MNFKIIMLSEKPNQKKNACYTTSFTQNSRKFKLICGDRKKIPIRTMLARGKRGRKE